MLINIKGNNYFNKNIVLIVKSFFVSMFPQICSDTQVCKKAEERTFNCRCPNIMKCVTTFGKNFDATCEYSELGLLYRQPKDWSAAPSQWQVHNNKKGHYII